MIYKIGKVLPWVDLAIFGGLALISLGGAIAAICTPQLWTVGGAVALVLCVLSFIGIAWVMIKKLIYDRPDFVTCQGVAVWLHGAPVSRERIESAFDWFIQKLPLYDREWGLQEIEIETMLENTILIWSTTPIDAMGRGWYVTRKAGLQSGHTLAVEWLGSIKASALFHELGHEVDETILGNAPDYQHENVVWWETIEEIREDFLE